MPIYEYECVKCGDKFEYFHWFGESKKALKCPKCGAENPKRVISVPAKSPSEGLCAPRRGG